MVAITKLKFGKRTVVIEGTRIVEDNKDPKKTYDKVFSDTCYAPPTDSFRAAVEKLKDIVLVYVPVESKKIDSFAIGSVSLTQEDDGIGLVISVKAIINNDLPWNFNTPYLSPDLLDAGIQDTIDLIVSEALEYSQGNFGVQVELDLDKSESPEKTEPDQEREEPEKKKMAVA